MIAASERSCRGDDYARFVDVPACWPSEALHLYAGRRHRGNGVGQLIRKESDSCVHAGILADMEAADITQTGGEEAADLYTPPPRGDNRDDTLMNVLPTDASRA